MPTDKKFKAEYTIKIISTIPVIGQRFIAVVKDSSDNVVCMVIGDSFDGALDKLLREWRTEKLK